MDLCELTPSGAVFKYDGDSIAPVVIPRESWVNFGRPTTILVKIQLMDTR